MGTLRDACIKVLREDYYKRYPDSPEVPLSVIWEDFSRRCNEAHARKIREQEDRKKAKRRAQEDAKYRSI